MKWFAPLRAYQLGMTAMVLWPWLPVIRVVLAAVSDAARVWT
jgi:hypothetical protein